MAGTAIHLEADGHSIRVSFSPKGHSFETKGVVNGCSTHTHNEKVQARWVKEQGKTGRQKPASPATSRYARRYVSNFPLKPQNSIQPGGTLFVIDSLSSTYRPFFISP